MVKEEEEIIKLWVSMEAIKWSSIQRKIGGFLNYDTANLEQIFKKFNTFLKVLTSIFILDFFIVNLLITIYHP